jgi:hypothetical protein
MKSNPQTDEQVKELTPDLKKEVGSFIIKEIKSPQKAEQKSRTLQEQLGNARLTDIRVRIWSRIISGIFFAVLLAGQNYYVFRLVSSALGSNSIKELQLIFGVLVAGTLTETYFIARTIVGWIFSENDYKD